MPGRNVEVAEALRAYLDARDVSPDAAVLLGDNFYPNGLIGSGISCWYPRSAPPRAAVAAQLGAVVEPFSFLRERTVTYALPGNHDYRCPRLGSLENQRRIDDWLPPEAAWGDRWRLVDGLPDEILRTDTLQVIAIDSTRMIEDRSFLAASLRRLGELLDDRVPWRVVAAHHPLYANGHHDGAWLSGAFAKSVYYPSHLFLFPPLLYGYEANYEWRYRRYRRGVEALFERRRVHAFLGGHEHALELLRPAAEGQPYTVISGSAARCGKIMRRANTIFGASKNGFAMLHASKEALEVEYVATTPCTRLAMCGRPREAGEWHVLFRARL